MPFMVQTSEYPTFFCAKDGASSVFWEQKGWAACSQQLEQIEVEFGIEELVV